MKSSHGVMGNLQSRGSHAHDPCSNNSCSWQHLLILIIIMIITIIMIRRSRRRRRLKKKPNNNKQQPAEDYTTTTTDNFTSNVLLVRLNKIKTDNPQIANCYSRHALVTAVAFWMLTREKLKLRRNKKKAKFFLLSASENTILADLNKIQEIRPSDFKRY